MPQRPTAPDLGDDGEPRHDLWPVAPDWFYAVWVKRILQPQIDEDDDPKVHASETRAACRGSLEHGACYVVRATMRAALVTLIFLSGCIFPPDIYPGGSGGGQRPDSRPEPEPDPSEDCAAVEDCLEVCSDDPCDIDCLWECREISADCVGTLCDAMACGECP